MSVNLWDNAIPAEVITYLTSLRTPYNIAFINGYTTSSSKEFRLSANSGVIYNQVFLAFVNKFFSPEKYC